MSDLTIVSGTLAFIITLFAVYVHFSTKNEHSHKVH